MSGEHGSILDPSIWSPGKPAQKILKNFLLMFLVFFDKKNSQSNERMFRYAVLAGAVMRCRLLGRADLAAVSVAGWQATWEEMGFCGAPVRVCTTKRGHMEYQWISLMRFSLTIVLKLNTVVYPEIWQWVSRWLWTSLVAYGVISSKLSWNH